jgi:general secretion pathway protein K
MNRRCSGHAWRQRCLARGKTRPRPLGSERGAALLIVVWVFVVLFVVVLDFAASMRDDGLATANFADETQAYYIALAGLNRTIHDVLRQLEEDPDLLDDDDDEDEESDEEDYDDDEDEEYDDTVTGAAESVSDFGDMVSGDGEWRSADFGKGSYAVRLLDESGRISLNAADEALLMQVFRRLIVGGNATTGVSVAEEREVSTVVHSILDWRDADDLEHLNGAEGGYYASLPRPYPIKNGPFDSVDELLRVRGITPELFYGAAEGVSLPDVFTVFNRSHRINVRRAAAPVLRVLLNVGKEEAEDLIAQRREEPFGFVEQVREMAGAVDPELAQFLRGGRSSMVAVEARGVIGQRDAAHVAAIFDLSDTFEGPRVFRWYDRVPAGWNLSADAEDGEDGE